MRRASYVIFSTHLGRFLNSVYLIGIGPKCLISYASEFSYVTHTALIEIFLDKSRSALSQHSHITYPIIYTFMHDFLDRLLPRRRPSWLAVVTTIGYRPLLNCPIGDFAVALLRYLPTVSPSWVHQGYLPNISCVHHGHFTMGTSLGLVVVCRSCAVVWLLGLISQHLKKRSRNQCLSRMQT